MYLCMFLIVFMYVFNYIYLLLIIERVGIYLGHLTQLCIEKIQEESLN